MKKFILHPDIRFRREQYGCLISQNGRWYTGNVEALALLRSLDLAQSSSKSFISAEQLNSAQVDFLNTLYTNKLVIERKAAITNHRVSQETGVDEKTRNMLTCSPPIKVGIEITGLCTCKCTFCSAANYPRQHMSLDLIRAVIDWCEKAGVFEISLSGGEPFFHPQILDILNLFSKSTNLRLLPLTTNGNTYFCRLLPSLNDIGVRIIQISVPAVPQERYATIADRELHQSIHAIEASKNAGITTVLSVTVFPEWLDCLDWICELGDSLCVDCIHMMGITPVGRGTMYESFSLPSAIKYFEKILQLHVRFPKLRFDFNTEFLPNNIRRGKCSIKSDICPAGIEQLYILPDGTVYPCNIMADHDVFYCGTFPQCDLTTLWNSSPIILRLRKSLFNASKNDSSEILFKKSHCPLQCHLDGATAPVDDQPDISLMDKLQEICELLVESGISREWL